MLTLPLAAEPSIQVSLILASVSLASSIVLAVVSSRNAERLARLASKLEEHKADYAAQLAQRDAETNARRTYEYETRKRLYTECEPLIFQLSEYAENAGRRVINIADATVIGILEDRLQDPYYLSSTMFRIVAPAACFVMMRQRLTVVDLRLDSRINRLYGLAKLHYTVLLSDFEMSSMHPKLDYSPHVHEASIHRKLDPRQRDPSKYWYQALVWGYLDRAASSLLVRSDNGDVRRIMGFGEFDEQLRRNESEIHRNFAPIRELFEDFDPRRRPTLWRVLTGLAILTQMFRVETSVSGGAHELDVENLFSAEDAAKIRIAAGEGVGDPLSSAAEWIAKQLTVPEVERSVP
jgi:hypothetical protein